MPRDISDATQDPVLEKAFDRAGAGLKRDEAEAGPLYRVVGDSKIPVSKAHGQLWLSRRNQGASVRGNAASNWEEAIRYYENDQSNHRSMRGNSAGNTEHTMQLGNQFSQTENVVFANCSIMVPMLYAKNPTISVTYEDSANEPLGKSIEVLINKLISMRTAPGLNFKPKARRSVLTALLTNSAIIKVGWTQKQDSSDEAIAELEKLSTELENAKSPKKVKEVEGKIKALEEKVNLLSTAGPWCKAMLPNRLVVDPTAIEVGGTDANWMMEWDYLPTSYLNAVYATEEDGKHKSVYEPTHVMGCVGGGDGGDPSTGGLDDQINNFQLVKDASMLQAGAYGYTSTEQLEAASYTKVWWVWDKTTRRVLMYADNSWNWPIWVWNDPLKLPRFFPYFSLSFHESVAGVTPKGEVSYYLDQQDSINEINSEIRLARRWARRNILYNKRILSQEDAEAILNGPDGTARGVDVPEGQKITDSIESVVPPSLKFPELFDTESNFQAINRITGVNDSMRGAQFKTNTTNKAVQAYEQNVDIRVDERVDLIEDFIGDIMWNISMMCLQQWDVEEVTALIGAPAAAGWRRITDPREFDTLFNARVEGGSVAKPNSQTKKQQAIQLSQAMGQFANAAPGIIVVMMKMIERAFNDSVVMSEEDWAMINETMMMTMQKAGGGPGQPGGEQPPEPPPQDMGPQPSSDEEMKQMLAEKIKSWPAAAQQKLQELVEQGLPPAEAMKQVEQQLNMATK